MSATPSADLYNDAIIREAKAAAERPRLPGPDASVTRDNPLCGDRVTLDLAFAPDGTVAAAGHKTRGCLLTQAAASLLARRAEGASPEELDRAAADLRAILRGGSGGGEEPAWPELAMFGPVSAVRSRHECVLLPFDALREALGKGPPR
jgi:nitrogen fixation protein NifU and related proteins